MKRAIIMIIFIAGGIVKAQSDSTDLNLYSVGAVSENIGDSAMFSVDNPKEYFFEFDITDTLITDTTGFAAVHIEFSDIPGKRTIFQEIYTLEQLESNGFLSGWHVTIPLGVIDSPKPKRLTVVIENVTGALSQTLRKTIVQ